LIFYSISSGCFPLTAEGQHPILYNISINMYEEIYYRIHSIV
jgi:hypothetical protein